MDDALGVAHWVNGYVRTLQVLILVLMDDALGEGNL